MSTIKVNEVRHLSNTGSANIVLESNSNINLQTTGTKALSVDGTLSVTGLTTLNGDTVVGNASTDTVSLISTISGYNNFSGFTGEIRMYAGNAAGTAPPQGWLYCNGDTIGQNATGSPDHQSATYQDLFNLLKASNDWGNSSSAVWGTNAINLPDFRSRSPVGIGTGAANAIGTGSDSVALTVRALGDTTGAQNHVLTTAEIPAHLHGATSQAATANYDTVATVVASAITATIPAHSHTVVDHVHTTGGHTHGSPDRDTDSQSASNTGYTDPAITITDPGHTHYHIVHHDWASGNSYDLGIERANVPSITKTSSSSTTGISADQAQHLHTTGAHTHNIPGATTNAQSSSNTGSSGAQTSSVQALASVTFNDSTPTLTSTVTPGGHTHTIATTNTGGGGSHNNLSPLIAVNFIIKV